MFKSKKDQTNNAKETREKKESILTKQIKLKPAQIVIGITTIAIVLFAFILALSSFLTQNNKKLNKENIILNPELARAMTYDQFEDGDDVISATDNVKFSSFFLRDLNGDGYAEKLKGTCKELGKQDTLYMELNVLTEGSLKNGKIEIVGKNFYYQSALPRDEEFKESYIGPNIKTIEFNEIENGTQKIIIGKIRSGDYSKKTTMYDAIGRNVKNYSRNDNKIILTGTYVDENGRETQIRKEVPLTVDWYGTAACRIYNTSQTDYKILERADTANGRLTLDFSVNTEETKEMLNIYSNYVEGVIPELNGYAPTEVTCTSSNTEFTYDATTRRFTAKRTSTTRSDGTFSKSVSRSNSFGIKVVYPIEAYENNGDESVRIEIPVETYYECYNNPNEEFQNPYKTNIAKAVIKVLYTTPLPEIPDVPRVYSNSSSITVGKYVSDPDKHYYYMVPKTKPIKIYNGISSEEKDDTYIVKWHVFTGTNKEYPNVIMKETKTGEEQKVDTFVKGDNTEDSMEDITTNVGIYFSGADSFLKEDGFIKVYDDITGELLATFTKDTWKKYSSSNPYKYTYPVKHIRIETSATNSEVGLYVYHVKELDDEIITSRYTREEFDNLDYIKSNLSVTMGEGYTNKLTHKARYEEPYSVAKIYLEKQAISTQITEEHVEIEIEAITDTSKNQVKWKNGSFIVKLPSEIITAKINEVRINNNKVAITSYEVAEINGVKCLKINTANSTPQDYKITIDVDLTPDPRIATVSRTLELYGFNEDAADYYYKGQDLYDVNDNGNVVENVNKDEVGINLIAPNSLLTNQTASEFDGKDTIIISPEVADLKPVYGNEAQEKRTVKIGVQMRNNYSGTISETAILGKIPFEGNSYVVSGKDLNSTFTTTMKDTGIEVPENLRECVTIYYSENTNPTRDLTEEGNGWTLKENVEDWEKIRTYLIDFGDTTIAKSAEYTFYYTVEIPFGVEFNKVSYSHHGIYFALNTEEGKYRTQTEPNRIGIRIAELYDMELEKYQTGKAKLVPGATYKVSKLTDEGEIEESQTAITNEQGKLRMANLYAERVYQIEEIKTPEDYDLNTEKIKIIGHINNADGTLTIEKLEGTTRGDITVEKNEGEDYKIKLVVEDEALARLKIIKQDQETSAPLRGTGFKITGGSLPEEGTVLRTNNNGEAILKGLQVGVEYTLEETKETKGYYLNKTPIKFTIVNNNGTYEINVTEGATRQTNITTEEEIPIANITIDNEKIPTYDLEMTKIKHVKKVVEDNGTGSQTPEEETTYLAGAKFKLYKDGKELGEYITDENGKLTITGLYQYVEEKEVEQTYVLKEVLPPEGYAKVKDIVFKVQLNGENKLEFIETLEEGQSAKEYTSDATKVNITVEDRPSFKLIKKDGETGEVLPNTKFAIYNTDEGTRPATNSKGEIIGTKEIINGKEYYTVTTDANGELTIDLPEGFYKAVEVETEEKYDISKSTYNFGIGASRETINGLTVDWATSIGGTRNDRIIAVSPTKDGGYIAGGCFQSNIITIGDYTLRNDYSYNGNDNAFLIKYGSNNEVEWATSFGGTENEEITSVSVTEDGSCIVGGYFYASRLTVGNYTLTNSGDYDAFLIKYGSEGEIEWATSFGGTKYDEIAVVSATDDGGYIIGGKFASNSITIRDYTLTNNHSSSDGFLIKFSNNDEIEWATSFGGTSNDEVISICETTDGGYIIGGYFYNNSIIIGDYTFSNIGNDDGFLIKYGSEGEIEWATTLGETDDEEITSVSATEDGGFIVGGYFESNSIDLGNGQILSNNRNGTSDGMIIKYSRNGEVDWGTSFGGTNDDQITSVITTEDGEYIVGGFFDSNSIIVGDYTLTNKQLYDAFLIKYGNDGKVNYAKSFANKVNNTGNYRYDEKINSIIATEDGGYIVGGYFTSTITAGEFTLKCDNMSDDSFIIKLYPMEFPNINYGDVLSIGGTSNDNIQSAIATEDGGCIVGGYFHSSSMTAGDYTLMNIGGSDAFIIKYGNNDEVEWATSFGGLNGDQINSISVTEDGGYIVGGYFLSSSITVGDYTLMKNGNSNAFLIKYGSNNEVEWATSFGGNHDTRINAVSGTKDGGYIIGGYFDSSSLPVGTYTLTNNGSTSSSDAFLIKYGSNNEVEWATSFGGLYDDSIKAVSETEEGSYIIGGNFKSPNMSVGDYKLIRSNATSDDVFLVKYGSLGKVEWATSFGGLGIDQVTSISATPDGGYIVGGHFDYSSIKVGDKTLIYSGDDDAFLVKYGSNNEVEWAKSFGGTNNDEITSVNITSDGGYIVGGNFISGNIFIGDYILTKNNPTNNSADAYLIKYGNKGKVEWATSFGGTDDDRLDTVCETLNGEYIVGGRFSGSSITLGNYTLTNKGSRGYSDAFLVNIEATYSAPDVQELEVENVRKTYKITTDVEEIDGIKGGSISGEDEKPYETVKYGDSSINEIVMDPDENYEIIGITVNGEEWPYEANLDGTYTLPQFTNMTEDKHIIVKYALKENKITINKVDSKTNEPIEGVRFKLDQIEERTNPDDSGIVGNLTENGQRAKATDNEITTALGTMTNNNTYYFVQNEDGTIVPTNGKTYQLANGGTAGINSTTANSYIPIDLSGLTGKYVVVVNARVSSESADYGYTTLNQSMAAPSYDTTNGRFMYISGTKANSDYISATMNGGETYYLHLGYRKDSSTDTNEDQVVINSIKIYEAETFNFVNNEGKYESTNQNEDSTTCNSYIPIDLREYTGKYNLTVNAEVSTASGDYGYATIVQGDTAGRSPSYSSNTTTNRRFVYITGVQEAKDYTIELDGGYNYFLHLGYYKDGTANTSGEDKFTINSVQVSLSDSEIYHTEVVTNSEGQAITQIPFGKYKITELEVPEEYIKSEEPTIVEFRSDDGAQHEFTITNTKQSKVTIHHYIKGTTTKVAEDEEQQGKIGEEYTSLPKTDLEKYELEKDELGECIIPTNAKGQFEEDEIEVIYYYVKKPSELIVHHYIIDEETPVPLADGSSAEEEISYAEEGTEYTTSAITEDLLAEDYELAITPENANGEYGEEPTVVTYYYKKIERNVVINKYGEDNTTPLEGAKFIINTPEDYNIIDVGEMTSNGTYYFVKNGGKYVPNNQGKSATANSYIKIDMTKALRASTVTVNAEVSSRSSYDYGYATINQSTTAPSYSTNNTTNKRFICISGNVAAQDYTTILEPGKVYYLHFGYRKYTTTSAGTDTFTINSIKIEGAEKIHSTDNNGKIELTLEAGTYKVDEIEAPEGYETLSNIEDIVINKDTTNVELNLRDEKKKGKVIVHHYEEGTTTPIELANGSHATDEEKEGNIGEIYATKPVENLLAKYEVVEEKPENASGEYIDGTIEVTYYYRKTPTSVIVHHYIEGTTTPVPLSSGEDAQDITIDGYVGDNYTTGEANVDSKYELVEIPANANGVMTAEQTEVTYYYKLKDTSVLVHYYIEGTTDEVPLSTGGTAQDVIIDGKIDDNYSTVPAENVSSEYELIETPSNATGTMTEDQIEVIYYYRLKDSSVIVHHYLIDNEGRETTERVKDPTGEEIADETKEGKVGDSYTTSPKTVSEIASKYELVTSKMPSNAEGTMTEEQIVVIYYYKLKDTSVLVHHYIEGTTTKVPNKTGGTVEDVTINGQVDDTYRTIESTDKAEYYELVAEPNNKNGTMTEEQIVVTYYYKPKKYPYVINYLEEGTNRVLSTQKQGEAQDWGTEINIDNEVIVIDGYKLVGRDVNGDENEDVLTISENENVINLYYAKRNDLSYTVYYKEKDTNRTLHDPKTEENQVFGTEITSSNEIIDIDGYTYDSVDKDSLTITTGTNEITIYYTKRTDLSYTVHYKEKDSGDTLHNDKNVTGRTYGEVITSSDEVIDINGYNYDSVDKETLTIGTGTNEITIYYTKRTDLPYTVHYVEKGTNEELHADKVTENQTFGTVITSSEEVIDIEGYNYDSVDKATLTIGTGTNEITIYYTKRTDLPYTVHYVEKGTNAELHEDKITGNQVFGTVITSNNEVIDIEGYNYDSVDKDSLTIGTGTNEITIYYTKKNDLSYTVNYLEKGTNAVLHDSKTQGNMTYKDIVRASDEVIAITGYNYDSCDKNQITIEVDTTANVINLYYTKVGGLAYTVNYVDKETNEPIHAPKVEDNKTYGDIIESRDEIIDVDGYTYDSVDKDSLTITTNPETNEITIYYTKRTDLPYTVHYVEKDTGATLHEDKNVTGRTYGEIIESNTEIIDIDGYDYDSIDKNQLVIGTETNEITIYYTKRTDLPYTVHYVEKDTNAELHENKVVTGRTYGEIIESNTEIIDIDGYNYDSVDKNQLVISTGTNEITIYYTKRADLPYTVHYKEKGTNEELHEDKVVENQTFGTVITSADEVITIDGYNYDSVDKESLTITTGTNEITIYYTKRNDLPYTVHYKEKGTNEELHEDKVVENQTFGTVITSSDEVIDINGYNYDSVDKDSLTITTNPETNEITIYYRKRQDLPYRVKYLEKDTERPLHEEKIVNDAEYDETILAREEVITIPGYDFDSYDKEFITITTNPDENIITIYYIKKNGLSYIVNYLEKGTNRVLHEAKQQSGKTFEETVNASDEIIDITAYNYDSLDVNGDNSKQELIISDNEEENVINIYYTRKPAKVIVHYYEEGTTNQISNDVEKDGLVNDPYETEEADDIPDIYELVEEPANKNGIYTENPTEVIYYYRKKATKVIVHHLEDPETNGGLYVVLATDEEIPGRIDDEYTTSSSSNVPSKYEVVTSKLPTNAEGTMTEEPIEVTYYYRVKDTSLVIKYVDRDTEEEISERGHQEGKVDERYRTDSKEVEGYTLVGDSGNTEGTLTEDEITVTYYYAKNTRVTVKYIDEDTGLEIKEDDGTDSTEVQNGKVGDEYTSIAKRFYGYEISRVPEDANGTMAREEKTIYYYYKKVPSGIIVNHIALVYRDGEQKEDLLESYTQNGNVGEDYTTSSKEFVGYDLVESRLPTNANGRYTPEVQEINYYYIKQAKVIVKYVDKYTGEEIPNPDGTPSQTEQEGHEGDPYTTERKTFENYVLEEVPANADGNMPGGTTEIIYIYKHISGGVVENHIDKLTGLQLVDETKHEGYVGEDYETHEKDFANYDLVEEEYPSNATGKYRVEEQRVTYYYIQKSSVTVRYIDKETNKDIPNEDGLPSKEEKTGHVGDEYTSEPKPFEGYILEEIPANATGTMTEEPTTVIYYYRKIKFNLKLEKIIKSITVNGIESQVNGDLAKAEVYRKDVAGQTVKVKYAIKVMNDGELEGSAVLRETIPEGMTMNASSNENWNISGSTATLETDIIVPGETKEYEVVLDWNNGGDNIGTKKNNARIMTTENKYGLKETTEDDNEDEADLIIAVSTGDINYVYGAVGLVVILGAIAVTFVKLDNKKRKNR